MSQFSQFDQLKKGQPIAVETPKGVFKGTFLGFFTYHAGDGSEPTAFPTLFIDGDPPRLHAFGVNPSDEPANTKKRNTEASP